MAVYFKALWIVLVYRVKYVSRTRRLIEKNMRGWNQEVFDRIKELYLDDNFQDYKFGASAMYFQIYEDTGVKIFLDKKNRNFAYAMQKLAHKEGVAPWVTDCFEFHLSEIGGEFASRVFEQPNPVFYGYLTQHAPSIEDKDEEYSIEQYADLVSKMESIGFRTKDLNEYNMSLLEDRLVCIDFDRLTLGKIV